MALIKTVGTDKAEGTMAAIMKGFQERAGMVPAPLFLMSASPGLFELYTNGFPYWMNHKTLGPPILACIRYLTAVHHEFAACIAFNEKILRAMGMNDDDLAALRRDPKTAPIEDRERELLEFAIGAITSPESATRERIDALCELGWTEADILDATYHGAVLTHLGLLLKIFGPIEES